MVIETVCKELDCRIGGIIGIVQVRRNRNVKQFIVKSKEYWPEIELPADLLKHTGTDVTLYALKDGVYVRTKTGEPPYEPQNVAACVILVLDCPWEEEHGWAAVFIDEKFVKVDRGIDGCVWLDCMIE